MSESPSPVLSAQAAASVLSYAESAIIEDDAVAAARGRAEELGATAVSPATGALLAFL